MVRFGSSFRSFSTALWLTLAATVPLTADNSSLAEFSPSCPPASPAVRTYADTHGVEMSRCDAPGDTVPAVGDHVVAVITLQNGATEKQWLAEFEIAAGNSQDKIEIPSGDLTLFTSTGHRFHFKSSALPISVRTHGPFPSTKPNAQPGESKSARILVNRDFLSLGFDQACRANYRIRETIHGHPEMRQFDFGWSNNPFPAATITDHLQMARLYALSEEEERAFAGTLPALLGFFGLGLRTPGLQEIMSELIDIPVWSLITHAGKLEPNFRIEGDFVVPIAAPSGSDPRFRFPVTLDLDGKPALHIDFLVTAPRTPYLTSAGILAAFAQSPEHPDRRAFIEIVSATHAVVRQPPLRIPAAAGQH